MKEYQLSSPYAAEITEQMERGKAVPNEEKIRQAIDHALDRPVDTQDLMKRIQEHYNAPQQAPQSDTSHLGMFHQRLLQANASWHVPFERPLPPTPGVKLNSLRIFVKRILRKGLRGILKPLFVEQDAYNMALVQTLNSAFCAVSELQVKLEAQQAELSAHGAVIAQQKELLQNLKVRYEKEHKPVQLDYVAFEDEFRGSGDLIRQRIADRYQSFFQNVDDILDIGCGRGEFMEMARAAQKRVEGCDLDEEMVQSCRERGLVVSLSDGLEYLEKRPNRLYGGIISMQVVEHLQSADVIQLVSACYTHLQENGVLVLETLNPSSLQTHRYSFPMDMTHQRFVHPLTLEFILEQAGFREVETRYYEPVLSPLTAKDFGVTGEEQKVAALNSYLQEINNALFGCQDYAVFARK